ncbi:unnamed protein product [Mortierella alpina]
MPDSPRQAHLILDLTYESLVSLQQQQQAQDVHNASSTQGISGNALLLPSSQAICEAIMMLENKGNLQGIQSFLNRTFTSLHYQVELLTKVFSVNLKPQLDIMDRITSACYRASSDDRASIYTLDFESIILERTLVDLLHPIWTNLHSVGRQVDSGETFRRIDVLLQVEELVASILVRLHAHLSHRLAPCLSPHVQSLVSMALRLYDECLLPEHLAPWCHSDSVLLFTGILALLEIYEHGLIDYALQAIHTSASPQSSATCRALIVTLVEYSGIFLCQDTAATSILSGDLMPSADVLPQLNCNYKCRVLHSRWSANVGQAVIEFLNGEEDFDHLYGSSWIQLAWIFVRTIQTSAPDVMENRLLAHFKLLFGLKISIQGSRGWFAKSLLSSHLDDILVLAWDTDCTGGVSIPAFHKGFLLKLMLIWLEKTSSACTESVSTIAGSHGTEQVAKIIMAQTGALRSLQTVFVDICREIEMNSKEIDLGRCNHLLHIICSVIQAIAQIVSEQPICITHAGQEFFHGVAISTLKLLSTEALPTDAERDLRELSQSILPLRTEGAVETASNEIIETLDPTSAFEQLSVHSEALQTVAHHDAYPLLFSRAVANIQLLLTFVELKRDVHDFFKRHDSYTQPCPELAAAILALMDRAAEDLKENRSHGEDQGWKEVDALLDLLLEALCGLLNDVTSSFALWRVLHDFRVIFETLSFLAPRSRTETPRNTAYASLIQQQSSPSSPPTFVMAEVEDHRDQSLHQLDWFQLKTRHPSYDAAINSLSQRWQTEAESINWPTDMNHASCDSGIVLGDVKSPYCASLRQAALDILALRALADRNIDRNCRTDQD